MPRKKPFSGKQKKLQLQAKRQQKHGQGSRDGQQRGKFSQNPLDTDSSDSEEPAVKATTKRDVTSKKDRYKLLFQQEMKEELALRKEQAMLPYVRREDKELETSYEVFYDPPVMFPVRPAWDYRLSPAELDRQEQRYFQEYIHNNLKDRQLGYVELNLETWRQLWRVLEMSDVLLHIIDVRYAPLHFNPVLYSYVTKDLKKQMVVILNKCDVVRPQIAIAWKNYLLKHFTKLKVVIFTSFPKDEMTRLSLAKGKQAKRRRKKAYAVGPLELWDVCNEMVEHEINIDSWKVKIEEDMKVRVDSNDSNQSDCEAEEEVEEMAKLELGYSEHVKYKDGVLTIGCVGYPNVGKSSVINGLMGRKVVSISRTPGHTKHFQTIFLTENVKLCDSPGLVFPSSAPRSIQVLAGMSPVSQLREPYSVVQYLAERCDLPACLGLRLPEDEKAWSAYLICDELAELKGFKTARGARTDPYRAANWILRSSLEGKIPTYLLPPDFCANEAELMNEEAVKLANDQMERIAVAEGQPLKPRLQHVFDSEDEDLFSQEESDDEHSEDVEDEGSYDRQPRKNPFDVLLGCN